MRMKDLKEILCEGTRVLGTIYEENHLGEKELKFYMEELYGEYNSYSYGPKSVGMKYTLSQLCELKKEIDVIIQKMERESGNESGSIHTEDD